MMSKTTNKDLEKKMKIERIEMCLNCERMVKCCNIGKFEECADFEETNEPLEVSKLQ